MQNEILKRADEIINGERLDEYGTPEDSFASIARLWNAYMAENVNLPIDELTVHDVAMMMILLKVARTNGSKKKDDNYIDICGYAALAARLR